MPVEIKELIVRGIVDNGSTHSDVEIIKTIKCTLKAIILGYLKKKKGDYKRLSFRDEINVRS